MSSLRALILFVDGVEDIETVAPADILRRAGFEVSMAGLRGLEPVVCSQKTRILPDTTIDEALKQQYNVIVVPGGIQSSLHFAKAKTFIDSRVGEILRAQLSFGGYVAAICGAPTVLAALGIGKGAIATSHPLAREQMEEAGYQYSEDAVVVDGQSITSRAPGTTFEFALKIVEILVGREEVEKLRELYLFSKQ